MQFIDTAGSFEDTTASLDEAFNRWIATALPEEVATGWVEATYPEFVIAGITSDDGDEVEFVEMPYQVDVDTDVVTFGEPRELAVVGVTADRWTPNGEVTFDPPKTIAAHSLSVKNATRIRRRLLVLANEGVELAPDQAALLEQLDGAVGGSSIPPEGSPSSFDPAGTLAGGGQLESARYWNEDAGIVIGGQQTAVRWVTGTYYLDDAGNLASPSFGEGGGYYLDAAGTLVAGGGLGSTDGSARSPGSIPTPSFGEGGGSWNENQGEIPKALPPQFIENAKKKKRKRLVEKLRERSAMPEQGGMGIVSGKAHPIDAALSAAAGLLAHMNEVKALDGVDLTSIEEAFYDLVAVLEDAGVLPVEVDGKAFDAPEVKTDESESDAEMLADFQRLREHRPA